MNWEEALFTLVAGVFLRLAVPVAVTLLVVFWLRWLDGRWQREAEQHNGYLLAAPAEPCWSIMGCSAERRKNCPAYKNSNVPCWQTFRSPDGGLKEDCLLCKVFRKAPVPVRA